MNLRYTGKAREDVACAFLWYEKQRKGLGNDFLDCMELALKDIVAFPEMFPVSHATFRRALIRRFPFSIFYMIEKETIVVHAVFDNRQAPDKRPQTK